MHPQTAHDPIDESLPPGGGRCNHRRHIKDLPAVLDVVTVVSNPCRYRSRYDLFRAFEQEMLAVGVRLTVVECAYGRDRRFEVTEPGRIDHVQVRTNDEVWVKENLLAIGMAHACRVYKDARYLAWIDADVSFQRPDFAQECLHLLQHYDVVQMFSHAIDLGPKHEPMDSHLGFVYCYYNMPDEPLPGPGPGPTPYTRKTASARQHAFHPGFAWAARREALDSLGGLLDFAILGSADQHMARALIGKANEGLSPGLHPAYRQMVGLWQDRAERKIRRNIGYVPGTITHMFHGAKANRRYRDRWKVLVDGQYNPITDITKDANGVLQLVDDGTERYIKLRDDIRSYFRDRDEDSSYVPGQI